MRRVLVQGSPSSGQHLKQPVIIVSPSSLMSGHLEYFSQRSSHTAEFLIQVGLAAKVRSLLKCIF